MRQRSKRRPNTVRFESLEHRLALAGNVTAALVGGSLIITGDGSGNGILVEQVDADSFRVTGLGTRVNGNGSRQVNGVVNGIGIDLRGGNDIVQMRSLTVPGAGLGILTGSGVDTLTLNSVRVNGITAIDTGTETDSIAIDRGNLRWHTGIKTRSGNDALAITRTTILGSLSVQMDSGADALSMVDVRVLERDPPLLPVVEVPPQFNILEEAFFDIDCGAIIFTGTGNDTVAMNQAQIDCLTVIDTNNGVGVVSIVNSRFGNEVVELAPEEEGIGLIIENGSSNDAVAIANTTVFGYLDIDTTQEQLMALQESVTWPGDGIDSVALSRVNVLTALPEGEFPTDLESVGEYGGSINGELEIFTGNNADAVSLVLVNTDGPTVIFTTDRSTIDGNDTVAISQSNFNRLDTGVTFGVGQVPLIPSGLYIVTGDKIDAVSIAKVNVQGGVAVFTQDDTDRVAISALVADQIYVDLGNGNNDALTITGSSAEEALFFGGDGSGDILVRSANSFGVQSPPPNNGFETIV
jgi:hypothetical protein